MPDRTGRKRCGPVAGVAAVVAVGTALRAVFLVHPALDSDQAVVGLMGLHVLKGEFPIHFWEETYSGTLESLLAAVPFYLLGSSRLTLGRVPYLLSLSLLLLTWRLGRALLGPFTGLLSLVLAAVPPMLLIWHSVLGRGNYIENLLLGTLLLLAHRLTTPGLGPSAHRRALALYGFIGGLAWYMSFPSVHYPAYDHGKPLRPSWTASG